MKFLVILILAAEPIILPFNNALTCFEQGQAYIEKIAKTVVSATVFFIDSVYG